LRDTSNREQRTENGKYVTVDIAKLISNIYVAPKAASWVGAMVRTVVQTYGLKDHQVIISELNSLK